MVNVMQTNWYEMIMRETSNRSKKKKNWNENGSIVSLFYFFFLVAIPTHPEWNNEREREEKKVCLGLIKRMHEFGTLCPFHCSCIYLDIAIHVHGRTMDSMMIAKIMNWWKRLAN